LLTFSGLTKKAKSSDLAFLIMAFFVFCNGYGTNNKNIPLNTECPLWHALVCGCEIYQQQLELLLFEVVPQQADFSIFSVVAVSVPQHSFSVVSQQVPSSNLSA
jgi:hypothetical protein